MGDFFSFRHPPTGSLEAETLNPPFALTVLLAVFTSPRTLYVRGTRPTPRQFRHALKVQCSFYCSFHQWH